MQEQRFEQPELVERPAFEAQGAALNETSEADRQWMESQLKALRKQARRHKWFGGISVLLGALFAFVLLMTVLIFFMLHGFDGLWPHLSIDLSLTGFGGSGHGGGGKPGELSVSGVTPALMMLGSLWFAHLSRRERRKLSRELAAHEDVRTVGPLIESLSFGDRALVQDASAALVRLLPRLGQQDAALLTREQRALIRQYLTLDRFRADPETEAAPARLRNLIVRGDMNRDLTLALLKVLERIGDEGDKPVLNRLAGGTKQADVQAAAQRCLEAIEARQARERAPQVLLRPAQSPADPAGTLLRPAQGAGKVDADALLRPSSEDAV